MTDVMKKTVPARQIALFAACVLPVYKLVETPSLLAALLQGDLLVPAILHYLVQTGVLLALLLGAKRLGKPLFSRLNGPFWYIVYGAFYLFYAVLPLLDLEKLTYAAFYDTAPTFFTFGFFFLLCAFICTQPFKSLGRFADISLFLFALPFFLLLAMALGEADFSGLLPIFESEFKDTLSAFNTVKPHFCDVVLLLPLLGNWQYKKGDVRKIVLGYGVGGVCTLLFLAVFYSLYSTVAGAEHYAFVNIAQYFPALSAIGRVDLLLVYALCVILFVFTCLPLFYTTECIHRVTKTKFRVVIAAVVTLAAFLFTLFCNKYYNGIYGLFTTLLTPVFWLTADVLPLFLLLKKENVYAKKKKPSRA